MASDFSCTTKLGSLDRSGAAAAPVVARRDAGFAAALGAVAVSDSDFVRPWLCGRGVVRV